MTKIFLRSALGILLALGAVPAAQGESYQAGEAIVFRGLVTDAEGRGTPGISVVLEATRRSPSLGQRLDPTRILRRGDAETPALYVLDTSEEDGSFRLEWAWTKRYDTFALAAALPTRPGGDAEDLDVLLRLDVTDRLDGSQDIAVALALPAKPMVDWARKMFGGGASADEVRVFEEMGRPDRVDHGLAHYDPDHSWWYFAAGRVYRFRDGRLEQVDPFEPIPDAP